MDAFKKSPQLQTSPDSAFRASLTTSFDIIVGTLRSQLKCVMSSCQSGDPVISIHLPGDWRLRTVYSSERRSAALPCARGSR